MGFKDDENGGNPIHKTGLKHHKTLDAPPKSIEIPPKSYENVWHGALKTIARLLRTNQDLFSPGSAAFVQQVLKAATMTPRKASRPRSRLFRGRFLKGAQPKGSVTAHGILGVSLLLQDSETL